MKHIQKGCLVRTRDDVRSDGSRIEGSHKGWNSLQRSFCSGLVMMNAQGHDHVLRRNIRIASADNHNFHVDPFIVSGHGSHHLTLVNSCARLWNAYVTRHHVGLGLSSPEFPDIPSGEHFGLVFSKSAKNLQVKAEEDEEVVILSSEEAEREDFREYLTALCLDPTTVITPLHAQPVVATTSGLSCLSGLNPALTPAPPASHAFAPHMLVDLTLPQAQPVAEVCSRFSEVNLDPVLCASASDTTPQTQSRKRRGSTSLTSTPSPTKRPKATVSSPPCPVVEMQDTAL
jgi:hypothetical protein